MSLSTQIHPYLGCQYGPRIPQETFPGKVAVIKNAHAEGHVATGLSDSPTRTNATVVQAF